MDKASSIGWEQRSMSWRRKINQKLLPVLPNLIVSLRLLSFALLLRRLTRFRKRQRNAPREPRRAIIVRHEHGASVTSGHLLPRFISTESFARSRGFFVVRSTSSDEGKFQIHPTTCDVTSSRGQTEFRHLIDTRPRASRRSERFNEFRNAL